MRIKIILLIGSLLLLGRPSPAIEVEVRNDIEFTTAGDVKLTLDAYLPKQGRGPFPCIVWVHGGGFVAGDKKGFPRPLLDPIRDAGFVIISLNYRLAPKYPFPACVDDIESGIAYLKMLIHGTREFHVPYEQAVSMHDRMERAGADCTLISILGGSHGTGGWEKLPQGQEYKDWTVAWLKKKLRLRK